MTARCGKIRRLFLGAAAALLAVSAAFGRPPCDDHTMERAGHPDCISWLARPSSTSAYTGYYVGGGSPCKGMPPGPEQGVWGWDYSGRFFHRRVSLLWNCRYQGGQGAYKAEGTYLKGCKQ